MISSTASGVCKRRRTLFLFPSPQQGEQRRPSPVTGIQGGCPRTRSRTASLRPCFPHRPTRFITRHAHEARHDGKVSLVSSYRPLGHPPLVRALAAARRPAITGKADSRCPASTHFAHGTPPNIETNTCCPRGGLLTLLTLNARPTRARCQRHTDIATVNAKAPVSTLQCTSLLTRARENMGRLL